jgi:iron complex outermembrane recepter protein
MRKEMRYALLVGLALAVGSPLHAEEIRQKFDIRAQELASALLELSRQARIVVVAPSDLVRGKLAPSVSGEMPPTRAIELLLEGSGLSFTRGDDGQIMIVGKPSAANTAEEPSSVRLEEIIVTATKRAESIQDVPLSIAAVTAEEIDRRGLVSAEDYLRGIPGVNQATDFMGQSIIIRGIETNPISQNFGSGPTVGTYFGETPTTSSGGVYGGSNIDIKLVDIERMEVLRGPQGTAFGSSSLGGVVRTIPVAPRLDRYEGNVAASYSVTAGTGGDNAMIQATGNVPLITDKLAIRATAYQFEESGYYRNRAGSDLQFQSLATLFGAQSFAADADDIGDASFTGGRIASAFKVTPDLELTLSYLTQKTETDGHPSSKIGGYDQTAFQVAPEHVFRGQRDGLFDTSIDLANATLEYGLGWGTVLGTFSHVNSGSNAVIPVSSILLEVPLSTRSVSDHRDRSGEIRLTTQLDGAWNFLAGVYAESLDDEYSTDIVWFGSPASNLFGNERLVGTTVGQRSLEQKAAFGEVSWEFLPQFTLTAGARAYDYERSSRERSTGVSGNGATTVVDGDASGASFRANLSYEPTDAALVYASWSQGFRLGQPQPGLAPGLCDPDNNGIVDGTSITLDSTRFVDSDEVDSYELGAKVSLLDRRLRIATDVYRIDWTGVPVLTAGPNLVCNTAYLANAGEARSEGIELQANVYVTDALRVDVGGSRTHARLSKDAPGLFPPGFEGDRLPGSPKVNANLALQYEFGIAGYDAFVRADSVYVGSYYGNFLQGSQTRAGDYVKVDLTARMAVRNLSVDLFVRNLTNQDDFTFRGIVDVSTGYGFRLRPRTAGVQLRYTFK